MDDFLSGFFYENKLCHLLFQVVPIQAKSGQLSPVASKDQAVYQVASSARHLCTVACCMATSTVGIHDKILDGHCECCQFSGVAATFHTQDVHAIKLVNIIPCIFVCFLVYDVQISM